MPMTAQASPSGSDDFRSQLKYHDERIADLQSTATTIIQLSLFAVAAGIAAFASLPISMAVVPPLVSVWLFYLLAIDRETMKHTVYKEWIEDHLNSDYDQPSGSAAKELAPYQWQGTVGFRTSYSVPWMIYGLYSLIGFAYVAGWFIAAWVLNFNLDQANAREFVHKPWDSVIVTGYCIMGLMIAVFLALGT